MHHSGNRGWGTQGARRIDDAEHALLAVTRSATIKEGWVCIIDDLSKREALVLASSIEQGIAGLIARSESRRFSDRMIVGTPHELDGVTNRRVHCERHVTKDSLGWCNYDCVSCTGTRSTHNTTGSCRRVRCRRGAERSNALGNTIVITSPV